MGHDKFRQARPENRHEVGELLNDDKRIRGRCGYIRLGYPFIFKGFNINKWSLHIEGKNGKLSDMDYLHSFSSFLELPYEVGSPPYFKRNPFVT